MVELRIPARRDLPSYVAALRAGWKPSTVRAEALAAEHLAAIEADADAFLASLHDPEGAGDPVRQPDGTLKPRLPGVTFWIWQDGFCGVIGLRWQPGSAALPPYVLGHVGYNIVPSRQGQGLARQALARLLPEAAARGLPWVELTTDPGNLASQRVILACGGRLVERFRKSPEHGGDEGLRFRIDLPPDTPQA
ncbi:GNAT family N-acetyltransferase [Falsiroseomonas tokyonensis]|uniref:GNAT family N-acetyltransferase n=1 Tax=Falsiroseomonas tokyonensis TaxID=430521 RepID=A0ABV7BQH3_9PROT|nr:GNAT family N-acetyltransferase [Falsiroseomonas tokyonensis]MBU8537804.1 GNAT family N-acetyltransferase [Falsiroseomonas tokyonensis]